MTYLEFCFLKRFFQLSDKVESDEKNYEDVERLLPHFRNYAYDVPEEEFEMEKQIDFFMKHCVFIVDFQESIPDMLFSPRFVEEELNEKFYNSLCEDEVWLDSIFISKEDAISFLNEGNWEEGISLYNEYGCECLSPIILAKLVKAEHSKNMFYEKYIIS